MFLFILNHKNYKSKVKLCSVSKKKVTSLFFVFLVCYREVDVDATNSHLTLHHALSKACMLFMTLERLFHYDLRALKLPHCYGIFSFNVRSLSSD